MSPGELGRSTARARRRSHGPGRGAGCRSSRRACTASSCPEEPGAVVAGQLLHHAEREHADRHERDDAYRGPARTCRSSARRPTGPPISSLPVAATSSSLVGRTRLRLVHARSRRLCTGHAAHPAVRRLGYAEGRRIPSSATGAMCHVERGGPPDARVPGNGKGRRTCRWGGPFHVNRLPCGELPFGACRSVPVVIAARCRPPTPSASGSPRHRCHRRPSPPVSVSPVSSQVRSTGSQVWLGVGDGRIVALGRRRARRRGLLLGLGRRRGRRRVAGRRSTISPIGSGSGKSSAGSPLSACSM